MPLSRFILQNMESILTEWDAFARTQQPAAGNMSAVELRDHAKQVLQATARDIDTHQTSAEQDEKSKGQAPDDRAEDAAAQEHGSERQLSGFTVSQLIAEFRALRASVLRLWLAQGPEFNEDTLNQMMRFNESIDQALAVSAETFTANTVRTRDIFLAILGHDLRTPLSTMTLSGDALTRPGVGNERTQEIGARIRRSAAIMTSMVVDLLEYSRTQLGTDLPVDREPADVADICRAACEDSGAAYPGRSFELDASGDTSGKFDAVHLQQLITNLLNNAAQYGSPEQPVRVRLRGETEAIRLQVSNRGPLIPPDRLKAIFDPLVRLSTEKHRDGIASTSLGLGLFIARQVTEAHGGTISVESSEVDGTVFTVRLPRE